MLNLYWKSPSCASDYTCRQCLTVSSKKSLILEFLSWSTQVLVKSINQRTLNLQECLWPLKVSALRYLLNLVTVKLPVVLNKLQVNNQYIDRLPPASNNLFIDKLPVANSRWVPSRGIGRLRVGNNSHSLQVKLTYKENCPPIRWLSNRNLQVEIDSIDWFLLNFIN